MSLSSLTAGVLGAMVILAALDITLIEKLPPLQSKEQEVVTEEDTLKRDARIADWQETQPDEKVLEPPPGGVRKNAGPDVLEILTRESFTFKDTNERTILAKVVSDQETTVESKVILKNNDRAGLIAWVTSPEVKTHYLTIKEALHVAFTADVKDLVDETQRREGRPTRNFLSFIDPGLIKERVVFIRIRERLYEFHIADKSSDAIYNLIEELTK